MVKEFTQDDDALLVELGVDVETKKTADRTPREERMIAGFEEIKRFIDEYGHAPDHGEDRDIFERLYAVRLDRLRKLADYHPLLKPFDHHGLLTASGTVTPLADGADGADGEMNDDALLAELGVDVEASPITELTHVRSTIEKRAAEEVASRSRCEDFETFKLIFEQLQKELNQGLRETRPFEMKAEIEKGRFFIVGGQKAYIAEKGDIFLTAHGKTDARLRVIFDNGTESKMLMLSLQRALHKDEAGRRITEPTAGPLFSEPVIDGDEASGTIYVLRSKSDHPLVVENQELVHKIGVTNMDVEKRIAGAHLQPTFLMANVEIVATYKLYNINRTKLENLIHRIFEPAKLDIEIMDRFGRATVPREWFLVPLFVITEAVGKIEDGTIEGFTYDRNTARLLKRAG